MNYLKSYVYYSSGTEVPEQYTYWAALNILGHILGNKVWVRHGDYFRFHPNLYNCVVGDAGSGKNTGLGVNIDVMINNFPELKMSASIQSREDIAQIMAADDCCITWRDKEGHLGTPNKDYDYRPFYVLNNELASFMSVDKNKTTEFMVEVFDGKHFSTGFKGDRKEHPNRSQWFRNPHVSLLAGAVPEWFMGALKMDLFSGGLGRRLIIVYAQRTKVEPEPLFPVEASLALGRVIEWLKKARWRCGALTLDEQARTWWREWYVKTRNNPPDDPILRQFHSTQHMQLLKVALNLELAANLDATHIQADTLQASLALLEELQQPIVRLTSGVGRNENAGVATAILLAIESAGMRGVPKKRIMATFYRDIPGGLRALDNEVLPYLQKSDKIIAIGNPLQPENAILFTPEWYKKYTEQQKNGVPGK